MIRRVAHLGKTGNEFVAEHFFTSGQDPHSAPGIMMHPALGTRHMAPSSP
jgi:hypothetical protein